MRTGAGIGSWLRLTFNDDPQPVGLALLCPLPSPATSAHGARIPSRTEPTLLTSHKTVLEYFKSRIISLPQVMFLLSAIPSERKGQTSKRSSPPCISHLALFYGLGVWFGFYFLGIAQNRKRTWHRREVSMGLVVPWSIQGLCPFQQGAPWEAASGRTRQPPQGPPSSP